MSVLSHLQQLSSSLVLSSAEKIKIDVSIATLKKRINSHFGDELIAHFRFGSSTRGTILPRSADEGSDIDYMLVFKNADRLKPQTYLNRLRAFVEKYYSRSEIRQSHPTIVLELNHIKFELVPAIKNDNWLSDAYRIPSPASGYEAWMDTSPNAFNQQLTQANQRNGDLIKPLVRLMKYWNCQGYHAYSSYDLERWIAGNYYPFCSNLKAYVYATLEHLPRSGWTDPQAKINKIERAVEAVRRAQACERSLKLGLAENEIMKLFPAI